MDNVNKETGIAYGVIHRNAIDPEMLDLLMQNGTDLRAKAFEAEILATLYKILGDLDNGTKNGLRHVAHSAMYHYPWLNEQRVREALFETDHPRPWSYDVIAKDVILATEDNIWDHLPESDDDQIEYQKNSLHLRLSGEYIFVCQSPVVVLMNNCSPCFPNAGDLGTEGNQSVCCYALPLDWFDEDSPCPYIGQLRRTYDRDKLIEATVCAFEQACRNDPEFLKDALEHEFDVKVEFQDIERIRLTGDFSSLPGQIGDLEYEEE